MISKFLSIIIAITYLILAYTSSGGVAVLQASFCLVLPLACIWLGDAMGGYSGRGMGRGAISHSTPGCFVAFGGWLFLLLPVILWGVERMTSGG